MPLKPIDLDDRDFAALMASSLEQVRRHAPEWTDLSAGDPGRTLLELFAHLTEAMLYRLNRLPLKVYVECLRLLGVQCRSASAARTTLRFSLDKPLDRDLTIPAGTRVGAQRTENNTEAPVFSTAQDGVIEAGALSTETPALHCDVIDAELGAVGTGKSGQSFQVARGSVIASSGDALDLVVGVETSADATAHHHSRREHGGKVYEIWRPVEHFGDVSSGRVYVADRHDGLIRFSPDARSGETGGLSEVPAGDREIRVWYRSGGGAAGNLAVDTLTELLDPLPNATVAVTNPEPATGGRDAETVEAAWARGPRELHSLQRAVTADDFRSLVLKSTGAVNRAFAYNKYDHWRYATRGTVEVICVPHVPHADYAGQALTPELVASYQNDDVLRQAEAALAAHRPLGTRSAARWGRLKSVRVKARAVVFREEDPAAVDARIRARLNELIHPLDSDDGQPGWRFGQPLAAFDVYRALVAEPGVKYVDPVKLVLDDVPDQDVTALDADGFQPDTWYAAAGDQVYRSLNNGDGWESIAQIKGGRV
ncbi:MAG: baseplate J/gp47 family protein, partial [Pseudomonadota bacterium]